MKLTVFPAGGKEKKKRNPYIICNGFNGYSGYYIGFNGRCGSVLVMCCLRQYWWHVIVDAIKDQ